MEEHSILPAFCAANRRNYELSVESLPQMSVPQRFDHLFVVRLNKLLKKTGAGAMTFIGEGNHITR